jgi:hypothetical protein
LISELTLSTVGLDADGCTDIGGRTESEGPLAEVALEAIERAALLDALAGD